MASGPNARLTNDDGDEVSETSSDCSCEACLLYGNCYQAAPEPSDELQAQACPTRAERVSPMLVNLLKLLVGFWQVLLNLSKIMVKLLKL